jgi:predicted enzyme related to lactoylglutathione lyase
MPDAWYPYLGTADVDATTGRAKELGATVFVEPVSAPGVGRFSVLADPAGVVFGLFGRDAEG